MSTADWAEQRDVVVTSDEGEDKDNEDNEDGENSSTDTENDNGNEDGKEGDNENDNEDKDDNSTSNDNNKCKVKQPDLDNNSEPDNNFHASSPQTNHAQDLQHLRDSLSAAKAQLNALIQLHETEKRTWDAHRKQAETEAETRHSALQRSFEASQSQLAAVLAENSEKEKVILKLREEAAAAAAVKAVGSSSKQDSSQPQPQLQQLRSENSKLRQENSRLRDAAAQQRLTPRHSPPPSHRATLSPAPSTSSSGVSTSTEEERKMNNIRKTYTSVKLKFDRLRSIAKKLTLCTQSMDLSSFGEFGGHLKRLREALEEEEQKRVGGGLV